MSLNGKDEQLSEMNEVPPLSSYYFTNKVGTSEANSLVLRLDLLKQRRRIFIEQLKEINAEIRNIQQVFVARSSIHRPLTLLRRFNSDDMENNNQSNSISPRRKSKQTPFQRLSSHMEALDLSQPSPIRLFPEIVRLSISAPEFMPSKEVLKEMQTIKQATNRKWMRPSRQSITL